jgi:hypothetical protein
MPNKLIKQLSIIITLLLLLTSISANAAVRVGSYFGNWSAKTTYGTGDLITYSDKTFLSLVANNKNKIPNSTPNAWQLLGGVGAQGIQGIQGMQGMQGIQGLTGTGGLKVFDANHNVVGDFNDASRVFMDINGKTYSLSVASDGFGENIYHNTPFYSTNDCTGTPYYSVQTYPTSAFGLNNYIWVANKIYEIDPTKVIPITANSMFDLNFCYNANSLFTAQTIQAETLQDLILIEDLSIYPTPFTIGK